jgi:hypothetical protein
MSDVFLYNVYIYIYAWACMQYYKINGTKEDYPST